MANSSSRRYNKTAPVSKTDLNTGSHEFRQSGRAQRPSETSQAKPQTGPQLGQLFLSGAFFGLSLGLGLSIVVQPGFAAESPATESLPATNTAADTVDTNAAAPHPKGSQATQAPIDQPPPDPSAAERATGSYRYVQRDVDALTSVLLRETNQQRNRRLAEQLDHFLPELLLAREPLLEALQQVPAPFNRPSRERDLLVLTLLDYQAERLRTINRSAPSTAASQPSVAMTPQHTQQRTQLQAQYVPLPVLSRQRTVDGQRHTLHLQVSLSFPSIAAAEAMSNEAPLLRAAMLQTVDGLESELFLRASSAELGPVIQQQLSQAVTGLTPEGVLLVDCWLDDTAPAQKAPKP
jgi:hypothetical protein